MSGKSSIIGGPKALFPTVTATSKTSSVNPDDVPLVKKVLFSGLSGAIATTCIYPIDICKTKLMNQKGIGAEREFQGPLDTFIKLFKREGIKGLYRGWSDDESSVEHGSAYE
jgi:hypothetical protein